MRKIIRCPECGEGTLDYHEKAATFTYRGRSITLIQPGEWCNHCGEGILSGKDMLATEEKLKAWKQEIRAKQAAAFRQIREKLHLTQKDAANIFGGGINAFSRYERGEIDFPRSVRILLLLLDRDPGLLQRLPPADPPMAGEEASSQPISTTH